MNHSPDREIEVFTEAMRLPEGDRVAFLARACEGYPALRRRVEELLKAQGQFGEFMEDSSGGAAKVAGLVEALTEKPGDRIGRYRLLEKIGEGGCGVVYMAEQEEPVRRKVAFKIVKPGMDTKSVVARFEAERQALALMDHPGIAKVLDAGATASGRPYFVMELVRGTKITDYCNQHSLSTRARLELFVQVCRAVEHAHQKGIIHRDIKPSNILVTENLAGAPMPVVIDFGIAKATMDQRLTDKTLFTAFEMLIGTPAYMSPEQAALTSVDVDTRTDIYSLGVLLYELLTGAPPFDTGELLKLGLDEVRRAVREREPPRPSTRLSTLSGDALTSIAQQRRIEPPALIRLVRGDLDWIAMRALEKDRTRRYDTASGLAADVQHYLADEVISARPPSRLYRLSKTVARNRTAFAAAAAFVVLTVAALVAVSISLARERKSLREAESARRQAETDKATAQAESAKSAQVTQFLKDTLRGAGPAVARGRDATVLREMMDNAAKRVRQELADQPASQAHILVIIGTFYFTYEAEAQAESCLRDALALCREHPSIDRALLAQGLIELVRILNKQRKTKEAISLAEEAIAVRRKLFGEDSLELATALFLLSGAYHGANEFEQAEQYARASLAIHRRRHDPPGFELSESLTALTRALASTGRYDDALPAAREAFEIRQKLWGLDHPGTARAQQLLAYVLGKNRLSAEAETAFDTAIQVLRKVEGDQSSALFYTLLFRAEMRRDLGYHAEAAAAFREIRDGSRPHKALRTFLFKSLSDLGYSLRALGRYEEAETALREALQVAQELYPPGHSNIAETCDRLTGVLLDADKAEAAEKLLNDMLPPAFKAKRESAELIMVQAFFYARRSRWKEGAQTIEIALGYRPDNTQFFEYFALLWAASGDLEAYRAACRRAARYLGTTNEAAAARVLRACLMFPPPAADLSALAPLGEVAANSRSLQGTKRLQAGKALFEYRQGHFPAAVEWAEKTLQPPCPDYTQVEVYPILAMAWSRLGQPEKARSAMEQLVRLQPTYARVPATMGVGLSDWREWIVGDVLMREAAALVGGELPGGVEARKP